MVSFLLKQGADPTIKDITGRTALDIAKLQNRKETIKVLRENENFRKLLLGKQSNDVEKKSDIPLDQIDDLINKLIKLDYEFKTLKTQVTKLENETQLKDKEMSNLKNKIIYLENENKLKDQKILITDKKLNELERKVIDLTSDVKTEIKILKSNKLERIKTFKDVEIIIDNLAFKDIFEVKKTLDYLEESVKEWAEEKLVIQELDNDLKTFLDPNEWKTKNQAQLIDVIFQNHSDLKYENFEINKKIEKDYYPTLKRLGRSASSEEITKSIIKDVLDQWKKDNSFHDEIVEFIKLIPIDKTFIIHLKKNFQWKMIPKWNQRREKLKDILKLKFEPSKFEGGLLIIDQ